ncbi:BtrH N-terminal domain-containing protein [Paenibacillus sp. GbtcB18]|uniref:BtrH N-terminal domain-containing protein n=1 Tax=Paenibacillus sp. GbtcB18 TaxID=2824763 RepID=UPI001C305CEE|nr:BtrH N-terminal domain-containing protein [Paenibacillus sp. GbtcB18]
MTYNQSLRPFNDFWMNCVSNTVYSIAVSNDSSYRTAAYLNHYTYQVAADPSFTYLTMDHPLKYQNEVFNDFIREWEPYYFRNPQAIGEEIGELLASGQLPVVHVDLFHWIPNSLAWKQYHWYHYSLITGYDAERSVYRVLDDDINGFRDFEVPPERLQEAFLSSQTENNPAYQEPPCSLIRLKDQIPPYEFKLSDLSRHAERLIGELDNLQTEHLWEGTPEPDKFEESMTNGLVGVNIIESRQTGNRLMLRYLLDAGCIREADFQTLDKELEDLALGWFKAKNVFIKAKFSLKRRFNRDQLLTLAVPLLSRERSFWAALLETTDAAAALSKES